MLKGKSKKNLELNKNVEFLAKIKEKQLLKIEYLKSLEENIKKQPKKNNSDFKISKFKQNASIEKYILSKNIDDSNNNNSTKISSLTNNYSENPPSNVFTSEKKFISKKNNCPSIKEYLSYKLSKIEGKDSNNNDEIEKLKKCLINYVDVKSNKRNKIDIHSNCEIKTTKLKNKSFSSTKINRLDNDVSNLDDSKMINKTINLSTSTDNFSRNLKKNFRKNISCHFGFNCKFYL